MLVKQVVQYPPALMGVEFIAPVWGYGATTIPWTRIDEITVTRDKICTIWRWYAGHFSFHLEQDATSVLRRLRYATGQDLFGSFETPLAQVSIERKKRHRAMQCNKFYKSTAGSSKFHSLSFKPQ